jgi:EpsI family protein
MSAARNYLVPGVLLVQALVVWRIVGAEQPPPAPDLSAFPHRIGAWTRFSDDPAAAQMKAISKADRLLSRYYQRSPDTPSAHLFVAWYSSQRGGDRQPHQPRMCLQGSGWLPESERMVELETPAGLVSAKRYLISRRAQHSALIYWYQTARRATGDEWTSKLWVALDAARDRRSDGALVRIVVPARPGHTAEAFDAAADLARSVYPELRRRLPQLPQR